MLTSVKNMMNRQYGNDGIAITPSDTDTLQDGDNNPIMPVLWIGGAGDVKVKTAYGNDLTIKGVAAGTLLPIEVQQVYDTDTTATNIVGIYIS